MLSRERCEQIPSAVQHHAAHACGREHKAVVEQQIEPEQAIEIDDVHGAIVSRRARENAQKPPQQSIRKKARFPGAGNVAER